MLVWFFFYNILFIIQTPDTHTAFIKLPAAKQNIPNTNLGPNTFKASKYVI